MDLTMRLAGKLAEWNDDRGFGFVVPNGGGPRAFVHIKAFERGSRRPVLGDLVSYLPSEDAKGRLQALSIRHAGQRPRHARAPNRRYRALIGSLVLAAIVVLALLSWLPLLLAGTYVAMSMVSFLLYWIDKTAAGRGHRRTPESSLHLCDLLGGWPGALITQQLFRHKTSKQSFQTMFWVTVVLNLIAAWWLLDTGMAGALSRAVLG